MMESRVLHDMDCLSPLVHRFAEPDEKVDMVWCDYSNSYKPATKFSSVSGNKIKEEPTAAIKFDQGKPPMSLLSTTALVEIAKVLEFGKNKYSANNWRSGFNWSRLLDSAMRHLTAFNDGEDKDPESGLSHLAHLGCCILFLLEFEQTHPELDDRYKKNIP